MASDITTVSPGHFMLPLLINKEMNIDKAVVETKLRDLDHFRRVKAGRPEELAILNVMGLMTFRLQRYEEALDYFNEVLEKDPGNLNALANLQYVLEKLFRLGEAEHYRDRPAWNRLLSPSEGTALGVESDLAAELLKRQRCLKARCLAEQAYAHAFDIHTDNVQGKRYMQSIELYQKALGLAGEDVERIERDDWKFCMAINEHRLFTNLPYYNQPGSREVEHHIKAAMKLFFELTHGEPGVDKEILWDSWCHLGDIFRTMTVRKIDKAVHPDMKTYLSNPESCMLKAMEISPSNARLLVRYANFLYSVTKNKQKPLELLDMSIAVDSSALNWKAFSIRAMINIKFTNSLPKQDSPELKNILQSAKSDLEKAISMNVTPWDLTQLGEVFYLLGKHHTKEDTEKRSLFNKALVCFTKSVDCPDGRNRSDVHFMRGRCLFDIGEKRAAIGCYKQAIDYEPPGNKHTRIFTELFRVYLTILQEENPPKDMSIVAETAFSLKKAREKYGHYNVRKYCIEEFKTEYKKGLTMLERHCRKFENLGVLVPLLEEQLWRALPPLPSAQRDRGMMSSTTAAKQSEHVPHAVKVDSVTRQMDEIGTDEAGRKTIDVAAEGPGRNMSSSPEQQPIKQAPKKARVSNFQYDFFVVYPKNERDWVSYDLLNELEAIRGLKGCTRDRDGLAGDLKITSEISLMKESASILLVVNNNFHRECDSFMHYALQLRKEKERSRVVIPILRDDASVPDEIDMILNTFDATGAVNWDRLAFCIEQQI